MKYTLSGLCLLLYVVLSSCQSIQSKDALKPNILFLFADDLSYEAIHALGNEEIHTPNIDRLVNMGVAFTHTYNMGGWNGAICIASRSMLISGRYIWRAEEMTKDRKSVV